jgi:bleomycin hydrolase
MMEEVWSLLAICLGTPPERFDVRLRDKDDKVVLSGSFTPQEFFDEAVSMDLDAYVSLISAPTADKPFGRSFTVSRLGNVAEDGTVRYLNLTPEELKQVAIAQLRDDLPVWFGCDVDQSFLHDEGIMDTAALDIDGLFGFPIMDCLNKAERLDYGESLMTHAMVLEGVRFDADGKPALWKVENSWGEGHGRDGFDTLSDPWFDEYVYQVVVDRKYLSDEQNAALDAAPIELAPWDPMGSLACCR